ncbi:unnamed protein product [Tuber aestivum]|uniref:Uncharacterized protein n=1 Tax=Tuber aestivum TaxID=59557 RepID=A0A292PQ99_9PEZI|nr:unnamed protein product [Tuber aestivum]
MTTPQPAHSSEAPFGYTRVGQPRKRPLSNREGFCPVKECSRNFRHRLNPRQAIWQHLAHYLNPPCTGFPISPFRRAHAEMHEQMKAELANNRLSENEKKERQKQSKKKWVEKNTEKRALSLKKSNLRKKAKRELKREGKDLTQQAVEELVEKWHAAETEK